MDYSYDFDVQDPFCDEDFIDDVSMEDMFGMGDGEFKEIDDELYKGVDVGPVILLHYERAGREEIKDVLLEHADNIIRAQRKKNVSQIKHALAEMKFKDNLVVDALESALHPELLDMVRNMLVPDNAEDLDDGLNPKNQLRQAILDQLMCMDSTPGKKAFMDELSYVAGRLYDGDEVVFVGDNPVDVLDYVMCQYPKSSYKIFKQIQETMSSYEKRSAWNMNTYSAILKYHRNGRRLSKSMNKITKVSQLDKLDQDNPYNWFDLDYDPNYNYYGINIDPRVAWRYPTLQIISDVEEIPENDDFVVFANLVIGDAVGGYGNNLRLLRQLNEIRSGKKDVTVAVLLYSGQIARGNLDVINVPRPHNMIVAAYLDDDTYDFEYVNKKAMIANQRRSDRYFQTCQVDIKQAKNRWLELVNVIDMAKENIGNIRKIYEHKVIPKVKKRKAERPSALERRQKEIFDLACNPDLDFGTEYYKIKPFKIYNNTPLQNQVMYIGNSVMAMNSVRKFVLEKGGKVEYVNGRWRMYL